MRHQLTIASLFLFVACSVRVPTEVPTGSPDAQSESGDAASNGRDAQGVSEAGRWDAGNVAPFDGGATRPDLGFPPPRRDTGQGRDVVVWPRPDAGQPRPDTGGPRPDAGQPPPPDDHANSMENAIVVQIGAPSEGRLERGGDEDFFRFIVLEAGTYRIFTRGQTDTFCHLLSQAGEELTRDDDSGENFNCRIERELQAGLYGIRLRHFNGQGTGAYTLHVEGPVEPEPLCGNGRIEAGEECDDGNLLADDGCDGNCLMEEQPPQPDDHSNSGAEATEVAINERLNGHLETVGDVDYFVVTSNDNQRLLVGTLGSTDTRCQAELVQGDVIALDSDSGPGSNCRMSFALRANRPVYLRIEGERNAVRGEYTLFVAVE